uniref:Snake toxin/toxin-like domain-containing protein n=1 Tax=Phocoena sinus TaxID=42100 RepID=A0A8C9CSR9_PHOSS
TVLLVWLLLVSLPRVETNVTSSGRQRVPDVLRCHVCEMENSFNCERPTDCQPGLPYCSSVAVMASSGLENSLSVRQSLWRLPCSRKCAGC